jgi:hypothetical protein
MNALEAQMIGLSTNQLSHNFNLFWCEGLGLICPVSRCCRRNRVTKLKLIRNRSASSRCEINFCS